MRYILLFVAVVILMSCSQESRIIGKVKNSYRFEFDISTQGVSKEMFAVIPNDNENFLETISGGAKVAVYLNDKIQKLPFERSGLLKEELRGDLKVWETEKTKVQYIIAKNKEKIYIRYLITTKLR